MESNAPDDREITLVLERLAGGEETALEELFPLVYDELRRIARSQRRRRLGGATLQTTALLHEAYLRFAKAGSPRYDHRRHFYAVASKAMRNILLDEARRRMTRKRGGGAERAEVELDELSTDDQAEFMIALDQSLEKLGHLDPRVRRVTELRYFCGLNEEEIAELLEVTARTVRRDWAKAKAWLAIELGAVGVSATPRSADG
ncbi:MAG: RNA polymerase subunit sigma-70 [Acidobacteria bacterium]|nr:MAG: RNA polymerase subunit sigma-70 [Acidobacteriota bacterium]REK03220.1 MAG: RNA polymerase subunit sigma-70 [Acidobacteriota bacterium]